MEKESNSYSVRSAVELTWATDKISQNLLKMDIQEAIEFFQGGVQLPIVEKEHTLSGRQIQARVKVWIQEAIEDSINADIICDYLTLFDLGVLSACVSIHLQGEKYATPGTIYATLGKPGDPPPKMRERIIKSINKLLSIIIVIDARDAYKKLNRLKTKLKNDQIQDYSGKVIRGALLPAMTTTDIINGQVVDGAIMFQGISPLYLYAMAKNEYVKIPRRMLEVPEAVTSTMFLELKTYISGRVQIIKRTRQSNKTFSPHIVLETIYRACRLTDSLKTNRMLRKRVREHIILHLNHLIDTQDIANYQFLKEIRSEDGTMKNVVVKDIKNCTKIRLLYDDVQPLP